MALVGRYRFSKAHRLRRRREFLSVQRMGRHRRGRALVVIVTKRDDELLRLGVTVSRKVGNAVVRNRVKRLIREIFRLHRHQLPTSLDIVVVAKREARKASIEELRKELLEAVNSLSKGRNAGQS